MKRKTEKRRYGDVGELLTRIYIALRGAVILERNYSRFFGEIDIIADFEDAICFVEVKRRASRAHGSPAQAVDARKMRRIVLCAKAYLKSRGWTERAARFDVAEIDGLKINYIRGAFDLSA